MNNFKIGSQIRTLLLNDVAVAEKLGNKVFPLIANANTTFPFLVYRRAAFRPAYNKDLENEIVVIEIAIATVKYEEGVDIANSVADALNGKTTELIEDIQVTNIYEDFESDTFIQKITLEITLK